MSTTKLQPTRVISEINPAWRLFQIGTLLLMIFLAAAGYGLTQEEPKILGGTGVIHRFEGDEIVIDDILHKLAPDVIFYESPRRYTYALRSEFTVGKWVGFKFNDNGEIAALWFSKVGG